MEINDKQDLVVDPIFQGFFLLIFSDDLLLESQSILNSIQNIVLLGFEDNSVQGFVWLVFLIWMKSTIFPLLWIWCLLINNYSLFLFFTLLWTSLWKSTLFFHSLFYYWHYIHLNFMQKHNFFFKMSYPFRT